MLQLLRPPPVKKGEGRGPAGESKNALIRVVCWVVKGKEGADPEARELILWLLTKPSGATRFTLLLL
jgi:hypothetical protein